MKRYAATIIFLLAIAVRIAFVWYTNYTAEDAHITFQFARNVARGGGFALNPGQPIYGTTTPLLTLLLAGWLKLSGNIYIGARLVDLLAFAGGLVFLYLAIPFRRAAGYTILLIALSGKLIVEEMQGMEMSLLFLFLAGSLFGFMRGKPVLAGVMAGLMLWTRVDALFWVASLGLVYLATDWRAALRFGVVTVAAYLPWVVFAWWYFGSPVPFTIVAKQVAYGIGNPPYYVHILRIVDYLTPPVVLGAFLAIFALRGRKYWVLPLFFFLEAAQLVFTGTTFFTRYFYLLNVTALILIGIGLAFAVERAGKYKTLNSVLSAVIILAFSYTGITPIQEAKTRQENRHANLTEMGMWLNRNTPEGSTILLEPLGYVGWYADRNMIDEVGLVTPAAVELHRLGITGDWFFTYFWPDYVVRVCYRLEGRGALNLYYDRVHEFGCFEVWKRR